MFSQRTNWRLSPNALTRAIEEARASGQRILDLTISNPTEAGVRPAAETAALNSFCRDRGLALIVDEVFLDYSHDGAPRRSFAGNADALTFTLSGVSKIAALPQMKLAWMAASGPEEMVAEAGARLEIIADTFLSMNAPVQLAAPVLLDQRKQIQPILLDRLRTNLAELDRQLAGHPSCTRLMVEGGWCVVLRVPATAS